MNKSTTAASTTATNIIYCRGEDIAEEVNDMEPFQPRFDGEDMISGKGYERDEEQSASSREDYVTGKRNSEEEMPIAHKRRITMNRSTDKAMTYANPYMDSGYEQDMSSDNVAVAGNDNVIGSVSYVGREEATQIIPSYIQQCEESERKAPPVTKRYSLGKYCDHSLDPDDDRTFAPIHRKPNFPESLVAILSNPELASIIEWLPHGTCPDMVYFITCTFGSIF